MQEQCRLITKEQLDYYQSLEKKLDIAVKTLMKYKMDSSFEGGMGSAYEDMMWDCTNTLKQIEELDK